MLASLLVYSSILPLLLLAPMLTDLQELEEFRNAIPVIPLILGGLQGSFAPYYLYIVEAAGAKSLYSLPMTRSKLASIKAGSFLLLMVPVSIGVTVAIVHTLGAPSGISAASLYVLTIVGSTHLNSLIYAYMLPGGPAHRSVETFSRWLIGVLMLLESIFYFSVLAIALLSEGPLLSAALYVALIYALSLLLASKLGSRPL